MNRRDAIAALVALPEIARISSSPVKADDVIVVECAGYVTAATVERIKVTLEPLWPGRQIVVCDAGMRIKVVARE